MSEALNAYFNRMKRNHANLCALANKLRKINITITYPSIDQTTKPYSHQHRIAYIRFIYKGTNYTFGFKELPYRWELTSNFTNRSHIIKEWSTIETPPTGRTILTAIQGKTVIAGNFINECLDFRKYHGNRTIEDVFKWLKENNAKLYNTKPQESFEKNLIANVVFSVIKLGYPTMEPIGKFYYHQLTGVKYQVYKTSPKDRFYLISESGYMHIPEDIFINQKHVYVLTRTNNKETKVDYHNFIPWLPEEIKGIGQHTSFIKIEKDVKN